MDQEFGGSLSTMPQKRIRIDTSDMNVHNRKDLTRCQLESQFLCNYGQQIKNFSDEVKLL